MWSYIIRTFNWQLEFYIVWKKREMNDNIISLMFLWTYNWASLNMNLELNIYLFYTTDHYFRSKNCYWAKWKIAFFVLFYSFNKVKCTLWATEGIFRSNFYKCRIKCYFQNLIGTLLGGSNLPIGSWSSLAVSLCDRSHQVSSSRTQRWERSLGGTWDAF